MVRRKANNCNPAESMQSLNLYRLFFNITVMLCAIVSLRAQTASNITYPIAACVGMSCPSATTIPTHVTASYFDTINEVIYIGGRFNDLSGSSRPGLAAINAVNGTLLSWAPVVNNGTVTAIAKSGDTVIIGGTFTQINGITRNRIAALSASTGTLFSTFATGTTVSTDTVMALLTLGGKVYVGGKFTNIASAARTNLARFTIGGVLESWIAIPVVNGPVKNLRWYGTNIVAHTDNPAGPSSEVSAITISAGARTLRASTDPGERICDLAMRGSVAYMIGPFFYINSNTRYTTAACDMATGTLSAWNPQPVYYSYDTRSKFTIEYYRDSLYIGMCDVSNNLPAYHKIYVSHYTAANLRVLKTYQSNLTGLNGYFNDNLLIGNARLVEIERYAQHTSFPNGSINCRFFSYCLKPPAVPGPFTISPLNVCPGDTNIAYAIQPLAYFSNYTWQSMSANMIPTPNGNSASVDFLPAFSAAAQLRVYGVTSCGITTTSYRWTFISPKPVPDAAAGNDDTLTCLVNQLTLHGSSVTSGATFQWNWSSGSSNTDSILVAAPDNYVLLVHGPNGCWQYDTAVVRIDTVVPPLVPFGTVPPLTCRDSVVVLDGALLYPNDSLRWSGPLLSTNENPAAAIVSSNYLLTVLDRQNGCENTDTIFVGQNYTPPNVTVIAPDTLLTCAITSVLLDANSANSDVIFQWNDTSFTYFSSPFAVTIPGVYQLQATDTANGCVNNTNLVFIYSWTTPPGITAMTDSVFLNCSNDSLTVIANSLTTGCSWNWTGPSYAANSDTAIVTQNGYYYATATHPQNGCTSSDSLFCGFQLVLNLNASNDTAICFGSGAVLQVFPIGGTAPFNYTWSNSAGNTSPVTVFPNDTLSYTVIVTDASGCSGTDSVSVNVPDPLADSILAFQPCDPLQPTGQIQVYISGGAPPYQFSIDNGLTWNITGVFPNLGYGTYPILYRDTLGCTQNTTGVIDTNSLSPAPDFLVSTSPGQGDTIVIVDISNPRPDSASWDFPATAIVVDPNMFAPAIVYADTGTFPLTMHAYYGTCEVVYTRWVNVRPFDSTNANAWNTNQIDSLHLYPNPNTGQFNFSVSLGGKQSFVILVYNAAGVEQTRISVSDADYWSGQIAVPNPVPGTYLIRVIAEYDSAEQIFVITQ
jgi:hypothetical protein